MSEPTSDDFIRALENYADALERDFPSRRELLAAACLPAIYQHQTMFTDRAAELALEQADEIIRQSERRKA